MTIEKYRKQFSHNMRLRDREETAQWVRAVRSYDMPEDDSYLHRVGINVFTAIGHTYPDSPYRRELFARLTVLERQRARNKAKEVCTNPVISV